MMVIFRMDFPLFCFLSCAVNLDLKFCDMVQTYYTRLNFFLSIDILFLGLGACLGVHTLLVPTERPGRVR